MASTARCARRCAASDVLLPVPNLLSGLMLAVPVGLFMPLAVSIVVAWGLSAGEPRLESAASRPLPLLDTAFAVASGLVAFVACALTSPLAGPDLALAAGRNAIAYVGLMLVGRRLIGPLAAPLLPSGFALITALFGHPVAGPPRWWAWPLLDASDAGSWVMACLSMTAGALIAAFGRPAVTSPHEED